MDSPSQASSPTLEAHFERFRQTGDIEALGSVFDASSPRLLALAGRVAGDAVEAEDLVQATFLAAMMHHGQWDSQRPLMPWLAGILTHRAQDLGRRRASRKSVPLTESNVGVAGADDPAALASFEDDLAVVMEAVGRLDDPYRELLALRITDQAGTADLAATLGRPAATIRVQLSRARERLGALMPKGLGLMAMLLVDGDAVLGRLRESMTAQALRLRQAGELAVTPTVTAAATAVGSWTGMKVALSVTAALLATLATWWASRDAAPATPGEARVGLVEPPQPASVDETLELAWLTANVERTLPGRNEDAAESISLSVRVHVSFEQGNGRVDAPEVGVYLRRLGVNELGLAATTDAEGFASFHGIEGGRYGVSLAPSAKPPVEFSFTGERTIELIIPVGVDIEGRVLAFDGTPVAGADVYRLDPYHHDAAQWLARTDASGHYEARDVTPLMELFARAAGHQPSGGKRFGGTSRVHAGKSASEEIDFKLGARGHLVEGRVLGPNGQPAPYAMVVIAVDEDARGSLEGVDPRGLADPDVVSDTGKVMDLDSFLVRADATGHFRTDEVPRGTATLLAKSWDDPALVGTMLLDVTSHGVTGVLVLLARGAEVYGRVLDTSGQPRSERTIEAEWKGTTDLGGFESGLGGAVFRKAAVTGRDGSYRIVGLLPGKTGLRLRGSTGRHGPKKRVVLEARVPWEWNPVVPVYSEIRVRAVDVSGEPLVGWKVTQATAQSRIQPSEALVTDAKGGVEFSELREQWNVVALHSPRSHDSRAASIPVAYARVETSDEEVVLRFDPSKLGELLGSIVLPGGTAKGHLRLQCEGFDRCLARAGLKDGVFLFTGLPSGRYTLAISARDSGVPDGLELAAFTLKPGESKDLGTLMPSSGTRLVAVITPPPGVTLDRRSIRLERMTDRRPWPQTFSWEHRSVGQPFCSEPLEPGTYVLRTNDKSLAVQGRTIEILPGSNEQHESWSIDAGQEVEFVIHFDRHPTVEDVRPECEASEGRVDFDVTDEAGRSLRYERVRGSLGGKGVATITFQRRLAPGHYGLAVEDERYGGWEKSFASRSFTVEAGAAKRVEIRLTEPRQ